MQFRLDQLNASVDFLPLEQIFQFLVVFFVKKNEAIREYAIYNNHNDLECQVKIQKIYRRL